MDFDSYTSPEAEELLRTAATRYEKGSRDRRTLMTEAAFAAAFLVSALAIAIIAPWGRSLTASSLIIVSVAFLVAASVKFPVAAGWTRPTQVVFVPMLFVLPVPIVPLVVAGCLIIDLARHPPRETVPATRWLALLGDSVYTLGPVLVLIIAGDQHFAWSDWPVYVVAFVAQVAFDVAGYVGRSWFAERTLPSAQRQIIWTYATDFCLSCLGLVIAASAVTRPGLVLLALPLVALLGLFARERQERMEHTLALSTAYRGTALLLGDVIEDDDEYTGMHSRDVVDTSLAVAERLGLDAAARQRVEFGALLHDVGKVRVPNSIINKPGKLDDDEWAIMRQHTVYGEQMLKQVGGVLSNVGTVVRATHERFDGSGYPDGLVGDAIPIEARIITACDAFSAMTTNRSYRPAMPLAEAIAELQRCSGSHFDPNVVYALLQEVGDRPPTAAIPIPVAAPEQQSAQPV
jgi:HD-GYP domain-containing protein (c-di-GMP phosphodiesterase class II)